MGPPRAPAGANASSHRVTIVNYFAHALPFLDAPYLTAGVCVPDWLMVVDRRVRLRHRSVAPFVDDSSAEVATVARGVVQHLRDDAHFHATRAFAECQWALTAASRDRLSGDDGFRPGFLGHLLTEVLLDAALAVESPAALLRFFAALDAVDPAQVERAVERFASRTPLHLGAMIDGFRRQRIIFDYLDDSRLMFRLNQVMRRVGLPALPDDFAQLLPEARRLIAARREELLAGIPTSDEDDR